MSVRSGGQAELTRNTPAHIFYVDLLTQIWREVQPLVGAVSLAALYGSALRHVGQRFSFLEHLNVGLEGLDDAAALRALEKVPAREVERAMAKVVSRLLELFESLAGTIILSQLRPSLLQAEQRLKDQENAR